MMRPKGEDKNETGLLEYLEDIIGTDKYVQPIEEASKGWGAGLSAVRRVMLRFQSGLVAWWKCEACTKWKYVTSGDMKRALRNSGFWTGA